MVERALRLADCVLEMNKTNFLFVMARNGERRSEEGAGRKEGNDRID